MPRLKPYSLQCLLLFLVHAPQHAADLRGAAEQERRLPADDVEVLVFSDGGVAVLRELEDLAFDHLQRDVAQHANDIQGVVREGEGHRLDVQVVAQQHGDVVTPPGVNREASAPQFGLVDDVVVNQRGGVDELDRRCEHHRAVAR